MAQKNNKRYHTLEQNMTIALIVDAILFIIYLIVAAKGIIWAKVLTAVLALILSLAIFGFLYLTQEWNRRRSLWMTTAAAAVALCTLFSLILNFPRPKYTTQDAATHLTQMQNETKDAPAKK